MADGRWPTQERSPGPLRGVRVLDLSRVLAGPYAAMLLADLGADVIKVEHPRGDETRRWGPPFRGDTAVYYLATNRNKRSIRANLNDERDATVVRRLAAEADVVIENFRPGVLRRWRLDQASVLAGNSAAVYCSITGFGSASEGNDQGAYDLVMQAMGGMMGITGEPGGPPVKVGVAIADLAAGMYATIAILGALHERSETGRGRHVEVALVDAQVALLANQAMNWLAGGLDPEPLGSAHPNVVPYQAFATATGYLAVAVGSDAQFGFFCEAVGRQDLRDDVRFAVNATRVEHRVELVEELEAVLATRSRDEWLAVLEAAGVPCGPVRSVREVFADPLVSSRVVRTVADGQDGDVPQVVSPFRFDGQVLPIDLPPPPLGGHDEDIRRHVSAEGDR